MYYALPYYTGNDFSFGGGPPSDLAATSTTPGDRARTARAIANLAKVINDDNEYKRK